MKKWKMPAFCLLILLGMALNWAGSQLAALWNLPVWLDTCGTMLCAYLTGPVCGAIVGFSTNWMFWLISGDPWYYGAVSVVVAVIVGLAGKRRTLDTLLGAMTTGSMAAIGAMAAALPLNFVLHGGMTGNQWGDAVIGFLQERGVPTVLCCPVGELYVEMLDKLGISLILYLILKLGRLILRRGDRDGDQPEDRDRGPAAGVRTAALLLAAGLGLTAWATEARAEETVVDTGYTDYVQTIYSSQNGLPCGEANDIAQTRDGILWIGTYAGLYRYNGREFRWMDGYESVRNVNCLYVDEEGRLWIGTNDNGLSISINEKIVNVIDQSGGLPANSVRSIIRSSDGYYYIGTTSSLQILTLNYGLKILNTLREVSYADHLAVDEEGHVAAVTAGGTLFLMQGGKILSSRQIPGGGIVYKSCGFDREGRLLAGTTGSSIHVFDISGGCFELVRSIDTGSLRSIKELYYMGDGTLFVTADNGVGYLDAAGELERINTNDFNNSIDNMLEDYQGNMWFTSSRLGLLRMARSDFRDVYSTAGMDNRVVNTIVQWQDAYYIGTDSGLDAVDLKGKHRITNAVTERMDGLRIRCLAVDDADHLWVCTYGSGLVEVAPDGTEYVYNRENGGFGGRARVATQLRDGTVLAAGDTGISFIRDHQIEDTILYTDGLINSMILTLTELEDGTILAGTDGNGIAILEDRKVTRMLTREDGLSSEVILRTVLDPRTGGVFIVTSNGLCYMNTDGTIRSLDNFPYFNNYDVWVKGMDTLYVMSSAGLYIVDREELLSGKDEISYELLDSKRGLNSSLTANSWTWFNESTGELYLACDTGVFVINTNLFSSTTVAYRISVPTLRLDNVTWQVDRYNPIRVSRGVSRVELFPEVINYTIREPVIGYWLEGFDSEWHAVAQNSLNSITYTNLPAGSYTFHLGVYDSDQTNIISERTYELVKEREFYDNSGFIFYLLSVPMFTVAWIGMLMYQRQKRRMARELAEANRQAEMGKQTVLAISRAVDAKDERTHDHSQRVAKYSQEIARAYGLSEKDCESIGWAGQMHDIGKIAIPDSILNKPSRLTDEEYAKMKSHTTRGAEILKDFTLLDHASEGAAFHHERYDGKGYPNGLKGEEIPLFARIIGVADAFDAMTANRVYRKQMDFGYVLGELEKGKGSQFDPQFVDILLKLIHDGVIDLNKMYHVTEEDQQAAGEAGDAAKKAGDAAPAESGKPAAEGGNA